MTFRSCRRRTYINQYTHPPNTEPSTPLSSLSLAHPQTSLIQCYSLVSATNATLPPQSPQLILPHLHERRICQYATHVVLASHHFFHFRGFYMVAVHQFHEKVQNSHAWFFLHPSGGPGLPFGNRSAPVMCTRRHGAVIRVRPFVPINFNCVCGRRF